MSTIYSCDSNILIQAWHRLYPPSVFPGVWGALEVLIDGGRLVASSEVQEEIERHDDAVNAWAKRHSQMFVSIDEPIQREVRVILRDYRRLINTQKGRSAADPWVIALAKLRGGTVLTLEEPSETSTDRRSPTCATRLGSNTVG